MYRLSKEYLSNMGWPVLTKSLTPGKQNTPLNQNGPSHLGKIHDRSIPFQYSMTGITQYQRKSYGQYGIAHIDHIFHKGRTENHITYKLNFWSKEWDVNMASLVLTVISVRSRYYSMSCIDDITQTSQVKENTLSNHNGPFHKGKGYNDRNPPY